jgi:hypothetical protein
MSTRTLVLAAFLSGIMFAFVFTGSAFAGWFIEDAELTSTAALSTTAKVDATSSLLVPALGLTILCGGSTLDATSPTIANSDILTATALSFLSCNTTKPTSGCALEKTNQAISTLGVKALATKGPLFPEDRLILTPKTKSLLAEISFNETNTCAFDGLEPVKGTLTLKAPTLQEEIVRQPIEGLGSVENNSLEIGTGDKVFLENGRPLLELTSGKPLGFFAESRKFSLTINNTPLTLAQPNAEFTLTNISGANATVTNITGSVVPLNEFTFNVPGEVRPCVKQYIVNVTPPCKWKVQYTNAAGDPVAYLSFVALDDVGDIADKTVVGKNP